MIGTRKDENILIIGDLNMDTSNKQKDNGNYLSDLCDTFSLKNLITDITCVKSTDGTSIDVFRQINQNLFTIQLPLK